MWHNFKESNKNEGLLLHVSAGKQTKKRKRKRKEVTVAMFVIFDVYSLYYSISFLQDGHVDVWLEILHQIFDG